MQDVFELSTDDNFITKEREKVTNKSYTSEESVWRDRFAISIFS